MIKLSFLLRKILKFNLKLWFTSISFSDPVYTFNFEQQGKSIVTLTFSTSICHSHLKLDSDAVMHTVEKLYSRLICLPCFSDMQNNNVRPSDENHGLTFDIEMMVTLVNHCTEAYEANSSPMDTDI